MMGVNTIMGVNMPAKFTVYLDKAKQYRFNMKATNGKIIASGESYPDKKSALKGIASIQKNAVTAKIVDETEEGGVPAKTKAGAKGAPAAAPKPRERKPKV
jgi:uncharacterized protein YegP (UPF0339 family)